MASSTKNVKLGVCRVYYGGVDLGLTKGGVEVAVATETYKTEVDQYGKTIVSERILGRSVSAKCPLVETTIQNMATLMPGAAWVTDGVRASATLTFGAITPTSTATVAGQAFTFYSAGTATNQYAVKIGSSAQETIDNFVMAFNRARLNTAGNYLIAKQTAPLVVTVQATDPGVNAATIAATAGVTASGAALTGGVAETKSRLEVVVGAGINLLDLAQELRLHPVDKLDSDFSEDFVIYKAATPGAMNFAYKIDAERVYQADFTAYPDPTTGKLFAIGTPLAQ